jgi:predicted O-linked N-acetylglucosamine transferase (SPINDLY family)
VAASLLSACGLEELIVTDLAAYQSLALEIARTPALHQNLRDKLRQCRTSAAFDTRRFTRDLENLLINAHRQHLAQGTSTELSLNGGLCNTTRSPG